MKLKLLSKITRVVKKYLSRLWRS